jgi:hypothetical protein
MKMIQAGEVAETASGGNKTNKRKVNNSLVHIIRGSWFHEIVLMAIAEIHQLEIGRRSGVMVLSRHISEEGFCVQWRDNTLKL